MFVDTVDLESGFKATNRFIRYSATNRFIRYSKCSTQNRENCRHVMHLMLCLSTLSIQRSKHVMHLMLCLSTLSIQGSSGIRNILLKLEGIVDTVEMCASNSTASIPDELSSCWHCRSGIRIQSHKQVHPGWTVFMLTLSIWNPDSKPQTGSSGIRNVLLKTERIVDM